MNGRSAVSALGSRRLRRLPPVWTVLAVCAVLVSLAVYAWPWLRPVLTAAPPHRHPWWFVTALFVHADRTVIPLYLHLVTNVAVLAFFGHEAERRLGSARTLVLVASAVAAQLAASWAMGIYGDGASGIAWALVPPALAALIVRGRPRGTGVLRSVRGWVAVTLLLWIWVVVTIVSVQMQAPATNVWHLVATVVGAVFVAVWWRRLVGLGPQPQGRWDVRARVAALAIPILIGTVLAGSASGVLPVRSPATVAISPAPGGTEALTDTAGRVEVRFDVSMSRTSRTRTSVTTVVDAPLRVTSHWEDDRTLVFQASRAPVEGEAVRIEIDRLVDAEGRPVVAGIGLTYD